MLKLMQYTNCMYHKRIIFHTYNTVYYFGAFSIVWFKQYASYVLWVSIRYGGAGPCADDTGHNRTPGMKNSQSSERYSICFFQ